MLGVLLTQWTIRLALLCFVVYLGGNLVANRPRWPAIARWIWTFGCGLFLVHVACAFQFYHHWSHVAAWEETARQTRELIGWEFGDGIYFSYLFMVLWVLDVVWLWVRHQPDALARDSGSPSLALRVGVGPRPLVAALRGAVLAFLFFIAFNGAIVFEGGPTRWGGIVACLILAGLAVRWGYHWVCSSSAKDANLQTRVQGSGFGVQE